MHTGRLVQYIDNRIKDTRTIDIVTVPESKRSDRHIFVFFFKVSAGCTDVGGVRKINAHVVVPL